MRPTDPPRPSPRRWRLIVFRSLALALAGLQLFNIGNLLAPRNPAASLAIADLAEPATHAWHAALPGAVRLILMAGVLVALIRDPARPLLAQWLAVSAALVLVLVAPFAGLPPILFVVLPTVIVLAAYPWPGQLLSASSMGVHWLLALLTIVAAVVLAPAIWQNISNQLAAVGGEHASEAHWALDATYVIALLAAGALASTLRTGWRELSFLTGLTFVYLGIAAMAPPSAGSWPWPTAIFAVIAGAGYAIGALWDAAQSARLAARRASA